MQEYDLTTDKVVGEAKALFEKSSKSAEKSSRIAYYYEAIGMLKGYSKAHNLDFEKLETYCKNQST